MSSRRRIIINAVIEELKNINGEIDTTIGSPRSPYQFKTNVFNNVIDKQKYLSEINDYPTMCVYPITKEVREYQPGNVVYSNFILEIRGYTNGEDAVLLAHDLADDIQYVIDSLVYKNSFREMDIRDIRMVSLATDEGLMEPYGICEIRVFISYQQSTDI